MGRPVALTPVCQVIAALDNPAAGTTQCAIRLSEELAALGHPVDLLATGRPLEETRGTLRRRDFAPDLSVVPLVGKLRFSSAMARAIDERAAAGAILHAHGLWLAPNLYPGRSAARHGATLVLTPHGMLAPAALAFSATRKKVFDRLAQRRVLERVACFHVTGEAEVADVRGQGLGQPVAVIPNGIDVPDAAPPSRKAGTRGILFLGRMHPIKGLDRLLRAWATLEATHPGWEIAIVGPSHGDCRADLEALAGELGVARVRFGDGLFGAEKEAAIAAADLFVLPSLNENFALTVAEALAAGTPVIATKGAPWPGLVSERCGWWIDHGVEPLAAALAEAMALPDEARAAMGARGRAWMARDFSWARIAREMSATYAWLAGAGDRPAHVVTD
jgi:glycosyltransferase involved in cell wall biosynthesis